MNKDEFKTQAKELLKKKSFDRVTDYSNNFKFKRDQKDESEQRRN